MWTAPAPWLSRKAHSPHLAPKQEKICHNPPASRKALPKCPGNTQGNYHSMPQHQPGNIGHRQRLAGGLFRLPGAGRQQAAQPQQNQNKAHLAGQGKFKPQRVCHKRIQVPKIPRQPPVPTAQPQPPPHQHKPCPGQQQWLACQPRACPATLGPGLHNRSPQQYAQQRPPCIRPCPQGR